MNKVTMSEVRVDLSILSEREQYKVVMKSFVKLQWQWWRWKQTNQQQITRICSIFESDLKSSTHFGNSGENVKTMIKNDLTQNLPLDSSDDGFEVRMEHLLSGKPEHKTLILVFLVVDRIFLNDQIKSIRDHNVFFQSWKISENKQNDRSFEAVSAKKQNVSAKRKTQRWSQCESTAYVGRPPAGRASSLRAPLSFAHSSDGRRSAPDAWPTPLPGRCSRRLPATLAWSFALRPPGVCESGHVITVNSTCSPSIVVAVNLNGVKMKKCNQTFCHLWGVIALPIFVSGRLTYKHEKMSICHFELSCTFHCVSEVRLHTALIAQWFCCSLVNFTARAPNTTLRWF